MQSPYFNQATLAAAQPMRATPNMPMFQFGAANAQMPMSFQPMQPSFHPQEFQMNAYGLTRPPMMSVPLGLPQFSLGLPQAQLQMAMAQQQVRKRPMPLETGISDSEESSVDSRKRGRRSPGGSDTDITPRSADSASTDFTRKPSSTSHAATGEGNLRGESRLRISFESLGTPGRHPQLFGKSGKMFIPDNVVGTHKFYNETWKFEIHHDEHVIRKNPDCVVITWKVTNLTTGRSHEITETHEEAQKRVIQGRTVCNKLFRMAMEDRAKQLEKEVESETNAVKLKNTQAMIKNLRPKVFSEGPLIFGLQHRAVQERMNAMVANKSS